MTKPNVPNTDGKEEESQSQMALLNISSSNQDLIDELVILLLEVSMDTMCFCSEDQARSICQSVIG